MHLGQHSWCALVVTSRFWHGANQAWSIFRLDVVVLYTVQLSCSISTSTSTSNLSDSSTATACWQHGSEQHMAAQRAGGASQQTYVFNLTHAVELALVLMRGPAGAACTAAAAAAAALSPAEEAQ
jgi:hypothetical protein